MTNPPLPPKNYSAMLPSVPIPRRGPKSVLSSPLQPSPRTHTHTLSPPLGKREVVATAMGLSDTGIPPIQYTVSGASLCQVHTQTTESSRGTLAVQRGSQDNRGGFKG